MTENGDPYYGHRTAESILETAREASSEVGGTAAETVFSVLGWAYLWINWSYAVILGHEQRARDYATEAAELKLDDSGDDELSFGTSSVSGAEEISVALSMALRAQACLVGSENALICDALDPEGYVRQRLQFVYDDMLNFAQIIRDLGHQQSGIW